jgi:hypothetical protein
MSPAATASATAARSSTTPRPVSGAAATGFETHLILPVPPAEPIIGKWRERFDPRARLGVPPHITALGPFVDRRSLTRADLTTLTRIFAATSPMSFDLVRVARFPDVVYLVPEPGAPFVALTETLWRAWPGCPPYAGAHREIVPHLTVAVGTAPFAQLAAAITPSLPVACQAREAWLVSRHDDGRYRPHHRFRLGAA